MVVVVENKRLVDNHIKGNYGGESDLFYPNNERIYPLFDLGGSVSGSKPPLLVTLIEFEGMTSKSLLKLIFGLVILARSVSHLHVASPKLSFQIKVWFISRALFLCHIENDCFDVYLYGIDSDVVYLSYLIFLNDFVGRNNVRGLPLNIGFAIWTHICLNFPRQSLLVMTSKVDSHVLVYFSIAVPTPLLFYEDKLTTTSKLKSRQGYCYSGLLVLIVLSSREKIIEGLEWWNRRSTSHSLIFSCCIYLTDVACVSIIMLQSSGSMFVKRNSVLVVENGLKFIFRLPQILVLWIYHFAGIRCAHQPAYDISIYGIMVLKAIQPSWSLIATILCTLVVTSFILIKHTLNCLRLEYSIVARKALGIYTLVECPPIFVCLLLQESSEVSSQGNEYERFNNSLQLHMLQQSAHSGSVIIFALFVEQLEAYDLSLFKRILDVLNNLVNYSKGEDHFLIVTAVNKDWLSKFSVCHPSKEEFIKLSPRAINCRTKDELGAAEIVFCVLERDFTILGFFLALSSSTTTFWITHNFKEVDKSFKKILLYCTESNMLDCFLSTRISSCQACVEVVYEEIYRLSSYQGCYNPFIFTPAHKDIGGLASMQATCLIPNLCYPSIPNFVEYSKGLKHLANTKILTIPCKGENKLKACITEVGLQKNHSSIDKESELV